MPDHFAQQCEIFHQLKVKKSQYSGIQTYWEHIRIVIAHLQKSFWSGTRVFWSLEINTKSHKRAKKHVRSFQIATTAAAAKTSPENKHMRKSDHLVITPSCSHSILFAKWIGRSAVEVNVENERFTAARSRSQKSRCHLADYVN